MPDLRFSAAGFHPPAGWAVATGASKSVASQVVKKVGFHGVFPSQRKTERPRHPVPDGRRLAMLVHEHVNLDVSVRVNDRFRPEDAGHRTLMVAEVEAGEYVPICYRPDPNCLRR